LFSLQSELEAFWFCSAVLSAVGHGKPWEERYEELFWRGANTHSQRRIMAESELVKLSGLADVKLM